MRYLKPNMFSVGRVLELKRKPAQKQDEAHKIQGSMRWRKLSIRKRKTDPLCEVCLAEGIHTPATEVHHIKPKEKHPELAYDWDNLQSICRDCHRKITRPPFEFLDE